MRTFTPKPTQIERKWHLVDASGQVMGRLATQVVRLLMGKNKTIFTRNLDTGDFVVVINVSKVRVTGKKVSDKMYYSHSGYPGGFKALNYREVVEAHPTRAFEKAIKGMLPHTHLGAAMFRKLHVYAGAEHPHAEQLAAPPAPKKAPKKVAPKTEAPKAEVAAKPEAAPKAAAEESRATPKPRSPRKTEAAGEKVPSAPKAEHKAAAKPKKEVVPAAPKAEAAAPAGAAEGQGPVASKAAEEPKKENAPE